MSKLGDLLAELAEEDGLSDDDVAKLADEVKRKREERANPPDKLATRNTDELAKTHEAHKRGIAMYGDESAREAYTRWREQEENDPDGVYGAGGAQAGGIFGAGVVAMSDYDPMAHQAAERRAGAQANVKLVELVGRLTERLDRAEGRAPQLAEAPKERGGALRRLLKGRGR